MKRLRRWDHKSVGEERTVREMDGLWRWHSIERVAVLERVAGTEMAHKTSVPKDGTDQCVVERTGEDRKSLPDGDGYCRLLIVQSPAVAGLLYSGSMDSICIVYGFKWTIWHTQEKWIT